MNDAANAARPRVLLASQSPRRRDLLTLVGIAHEVAPADVDERLRAGENPAGYAERLAREKAEAIVARGSGDDAVVIAADTIVVLDDDVLGKPRDAVDARRTLRRLSGRRHTVVTAVAVIYRGRCASAVEEVGVHVRELDDDEIAAYVATGEPMDKAGSYGIQGFGATIVTRVDGDYFSVMGLPLARLVALCATLGLDYRFGPLVASA